MQLNVTTDYAIRTVLYLGQCKKIASATEISNEMGIPRGYLEKVLSKLKKAEYISADLGARGGYRLNKTLKDITLGDVIRLMESTTKINRCLEDDAYCSRKAVDFCAVRRYYAKVQEKLETQFFSIAADGDCFGAGNSERAADRYAAHTAAAGSKNADAVRRVRRRTDRSVVG